VPTEQRVIAPKKIGGGKIGATKGAPEPEPTAGKKPKKAKGGGKKKKLIISGAAALVVVVAAAYFLVIAPKGKSGSDEPPKPVAVVQFEPHSLNLADGHYLRLGFALELAKTGGGHGGEELDAAPALDAAIAVFSGRTVAEVTDPATRELLRAELLAKVQEHYGEDVVMGVKFSDYVTQ
jgi:flagellar FliL protein